MLSDSLTYDGVADLTVTGALTIASGNNQRPLIRLAAATPWTITGGSADAALALDGLFVSGQDIVLAGQFASVTITCSTLDPGSAAAAVLPGALEFAADAALPALGGWPRPAPHPGSGSPARSKP